MADVKTQLKTIQIKWVNRLISGDEMKWKVIPKYYLNKYDNDVLVFKMNFGGIKELKDIKIPSFYKNILETWVNEGGGNSSEPKNFESIRNQILWGNKFIKCAGKSLLYKNWIDANITCSYNMWLMKVKESQQFQCFASHATDIHTNEFQPTNKAVFICTTR